jgi:hypothetical protein
MFSRVQQRLLLLFAVLASAYADHPASVIQAAKAEADLCGATTPGAVPSDVLFQDNSCNGQPDGIYPLDLSRGCTSYILCCQASVEAQTSRNVSVMTLLAVLTHVGKQRFAVPVLRRASHS